MKKSTVILLSWFAFAFIVSLFLTSCSDQQNKIVISYEDYDLVDSMNINENPILIRIIEPDSTILDLNENPIIVGDVYVRTKGILEPVYLGINSLDHFVSNSSDTTAKWILYPDLWVRTLSHVSSWRTINAEILYLKDIKLQVDRKIYVTFDLYE